MGRGEKGLEGLAQTFDQQTGSLGADAPADVVSREVYEAAIKGRQDFRNAYRRELKARRELLDELGLVIRRTLGGRK